MIGEKTEQLSYKVKNAKAHTILSFIDSDTYLQSSCTRFICPPFNCILPHTVTHKMNEASHTLLLITLTNPIIIPFQRVPESPLYLYSHRHPASACCGWLIRKKEWANRTCFFLSFFIHHSFCCLISINDECVDYQKNHRGKKMDPAKRHGFNFMHPLPSHKDNVWMG